jgi:hypothetical protein
MRSPATFRGAELERDLEDPIGAAIARADRQLKRRRLERRLAELEREI